MKLIVSSTELTSLIKEKYVRPGSIPGTYILLIVNPFNKQLDLAISVDDNIPFSSSNTEIIINDSSTKNEKNENYDSSSPVNTPVKQESLFENIEDWIDEWRSLWSGKRIKGMGDRSECVIRMKEFLKLYPQFDKTIVFKARDMYLSEFKGDYSYLEQADFFIKKNVRTEEGTVIRRTLLQYCESIVFKETLLKDQTEKKHYNGFKDI